MTASQAMEILSNLETGDKLNYISNSIFIFLCGVLVFSMQAGFALLETGMTRSKNTSNIWMKNLMDFCVGVFAYFLVGYGLQYGDDFHGLFGTTGFLNPFNSEMQIWADCVDMQLNPYIYFFFQMAFCGATATIISGAVAERFKFGSYLICSLFMTGLVYPVGSHWIWGGGWLSQLGFVDFAGTLAVHGIGGMAALVCAAFVGPRIGKYDANGESHSIRGHNISLFGLGAIFLWFGWYGFNPGSELGFDDAAAYAAIAPGAVDFPDELVCDPKVKLVVDNKKLYEAWAEEYPYPTFDKMFLLGDKFTDLAHDGKLDWNVVQNIGAIANGKVPGRESEDQIILYSIGGMPVEDVAWGKTVYETALEKEIGTMLNLWDKPYLY